jgi:hypothetical protein
VREALQTKKRHKQEGVPFDFQQRQEYHGGAVMWSPRKGREAEVRMTIMERQAEQQKLNKAKRKQEMEDAKIQKQFELEQRRDERETQEGEGEGEGQEGC